MLCRTAKGRDNLTCHCSTCIQAVSTALPEIICTDLIWLLDSPVRTGSLAEVHGTLETKTEGTVRVKNRLLLVFSDSVDNIQWLSSIKSCSKPSHPQETIIEDFILS